MFNNLQQIMQLMNNPMFKIISQAKTPQQAVQMLTKMNPNIGNNIMLNNAMNMMNNGDSKGVETMARNLVKNAGGDPDQVYSMLNNMKS